jgi:signal transduction histidine kinase
MMRYARWFTPLWPGLTQLWFSGAWWGLAIGCGFAWLLNLAIASTLVWTEWIDPVSRLGVWVLLMLVWTASVTLSFRQLLGYNPEETAKTAEALFRQGQREYLSGNWIKAEQLLTQLLTIDGKDVDAHLMMVSLLRRTGQLAEAADRLRRLATMDGADKWGSEIERERKQLDGLFEELNTTSNNTAENEEREEDEPIETSINRVEQEKQPAPKAA